MTIFTRNPEQRKLLEDKHVCVVGCGSVGSAISEMLVRAGVGRLTLTDPENLDPENIGRHMLTQKDLGRPKVEAMKARLQEINPDCRIAVYATEFERTIGISSPAQKSSGVDFKKFDLLVSCADSYRCQSVINGISLQYKIPAVYPGCWGAATTGEIYFVLPDKTPCYECFNKFRAKVEIPADPRKYADPDFDDSKVPGQPGLWANILVICGVAFHVIMGIFQNDLPKQNLWLMNLTGEDLQPFALTYGKVKKGCAVCDESLLEELTA